MKQSGISRLQLLLWAVGVTGLGAARADTSRSDLERLASSSLEELMQIPVTTVAGAPQSRMSSPAAVYVISADDIRRSGHREVAEVLRMVPGMYVGRINSASWLVGSRGLTGSTLTATRYLVLVDGRLVYDPLISTTFWDTADLILADIDRIEVIRGPGATLWGANAMNGVINIVTREARDTPGTLAQLSVGDQDGLEVNLRHGVQLDDASWVRVWSRYVEHGDFRNRDGSSLQDEWASLRAGFRYDRQMDPETLLSVFGEAYGHPRSRLSVVLPVPGQDRQVERVTTDRSIGGGSLMLRVNRGFGSSHGWRLRAYVDHTQRDTAHFSANRRTLDLDYRRWQRWADGQDLMWGAEYLWTQDETAGPMLTFDPSSRSWSQLNAFVQNTSELVKDRWYLMAGSKLNQHSFSGFHVQPNVRLWWTPSPQQTVWASVSRPVRMPSRFEEDGTLILGYIDAGALAGGTPTGVIVPRVISGDAALEPEKLLAYELGHRIKLGRHWLVETSFFYNDYRRLIEPAAATFGPFTDAGSGRSRGVEISASGQLTDAWRLDASYSRLDVQINGPVLQFEEKSSPAHLAQLRSQLDVGANSEFNAAAYYVDNIRQTGIPAYTRLDLGWTLKLGEDTRLAVWGQNLLQAGHSEASGAQVPRSVYAQVSVGLGR